MSASPNRQLNAWQGAFGDAYIDRNAPTREAVAARARMWARILERLAPGSPSSILEVGCNVGMNLRALPHVTQAQLSAVEPNARARARLIADGVLPSSQIYEGSAAALPFADAAFDLVFTSGVLIHVAPDELGRAVDEIVRVAARFVVCCEYFSTTPEERTYRGERELLFKRDFGGFFLDRCANLKLLDYGFFWRRATGLDDVVWQLFEKA